MCKTYFHIPVELPLAEKITFTIVLSEIHSVLLLLLVCSISSHMLYLYIHICKNKKKMGDGLHKSVDFLPNPIV